MASTGAIQDATFDNHCWGCGPLNERGLGIKSYWQGDGAVCTWQPSEEHSAGPRGVLNGGIIATIMDCHSICTAIADAYAREGRPLGTKPDIWCVTGSLQISYLKPTPLDQPITVRSTVESRSGRRTTVVCSLFSGEGEEEYARSEAVAVRVDGGWQRDRTPPSP